VDHAPYIGAGRTFPLFPAPEIFMPRLALVLVLLAACATVPPDPAPAPAAAAAPMTPAAPMPAASPAGITGEYTVTIAPADMPGEMPDNVKQMMVGAWNIGLHEGNHVLVTQNGREVLSGPYMVSGSQVTFPANDTGSYACRTTATYTWQMSGDQLTLTRVRDTCDGRSRVFTMRPLTRRG
jgi:hypothetical protein